MPPLGPTNFAIISKGFRNEIKEGVTIGAGAGFMDFIYILIAYGGVSIIISLIPENTVEFIESNEMYFKSALTLAGCIIVVFYGFKIKSKKVLNENETNNLDLQIQKVEDKVENTLLKTEKEIDKILHTKVLAKPKSGFLEAFLTGAFLCLSSITLPASWFAVVGYLKSYGIIDTTFLSGLSLAAGVFLGTTFWFYTLSKFIAVNSHRIKPTTLNKLNIAVGYILILLGIFLFYKAFDFAFS